MLKRSITLLAATMVLATPALAKPNDHNNGRGWGVGQIPPGHQKKLNVIEEQRLTDYVIIDNPTYYGLPVLSADQMYVLADDNVYRVMRDTVVVVEAIGIISQLLTR